MIIETERMELQPLTLTQTNLEKQAGGDSGSNLGNMIAIVDSKKVC